MAGAAEARRTGAAGWWWVATAGVVAGVSTLAQPAAILEPRLGLGFVLQVVLPYGVAVVLCLRLVRHRRLDRRTRLAWLLFGLAMACLAAGLLLDQVAGAGIVVGVSWSSVLFLAYYPVLVAGLLCLPTRRSSAKERVRSGLDLVLVAVSLAMLSWYVVLGPLVRAGAPDTLGLVVVVAYPVGDLVQVFGVAVILLRTVPEASRIPMRFMAGAVTAFTLLDTAGVASALHGMTALEAWIPALSLVFALLVAAGAQAQYTGGLRERRVEGVAVADVTASRLPYLAVALAYGLLLVVARGVDLYPLGGLVLGAVVLTAGVLARQLTVVHDNRELAMTDALTGLANRALLYSRLAAALDAVRRGGGHVGVLLIDLNKFKPVNDSYGHEAGDALLVAVGPRLRGAVRAPQVVARFGGDEFAVLVEGLADPDDVVGIAERVLDQLCGPVVYQGHLLEVGASIGVATSNRDDPDSLTAEGLIRRADLAMYAAKRTGTDTYRVFTADLAARDPRAELQQAIDRDELVLDYQTIVDLDTGRPTGVEALVRWQHPNRGLLPPGEFIPLAEESGLIVPLGAWVLDRAFAQLRTWRDTLPGAAGLSLSVNVSPAQIRRAGFVAEVTALLDRHGVDPAAVVLELTEGTNLVVGAEARTTIDALRNLGIRIAVDDFGTGYAALSYLREIPVDILKIDRSFVSGVVDDETSRIIGEAIVNLGRALKLDVVAEGIETPDQQRALAAMSCTHGQGYRFARPQDAATTTSLLAGLAAEPHEPATTRAGDTTR